ncbi:MAG TPA: 50S ribosomal protein L29 [Anaerolineales bacterium]|nr:50S ribosomal protein L29 [Anaerolineales bacterium]
MKAREMRDLSLDDLRGRLDEAREAFFRLRFQAATGQLKNTAQLRQARREIGRLATVVREREQEGEKA